MRFLKRSELRPVFEGKSVAIVGSGPGVLDNEEGFIDSHDVVVRVNNYRLAKPTGSRTDVFYSFFGKSIRRTARELRNDGVTLCMSKVPNSRPIHSRWHLERGKVSGIDFKYIYQYRERFWFCDTYIPEDGAFLDKFNLLGERVPTTGFAAILDVLEFNPRQVYLTGFDFFRSGVHNVYEHWLSRNDGDPIGHVPERECQWLADNIDKYPIRLDPTLERIIRQNPSPSDMKTRMVSIVGPDIMRRSALGIRDGAGVIERVLKGGGYKTVLEIGTYRGATAAWMAQFVDKVITVDLAEGQLERQGIAWDRQAFWQKLGIKNIELRLARSERHKASIIKSLDFDFAFIDGDHRGEAPGRDFDLVKRCGAVLFHDHDRENPGAVVDFVKTLPRNQVELIDIFALWKA